METTPQGPQSIYDCNLIEALNLAQQHADETDLLISLGKMWMQRKSDVSYRDVVMLDLASCSLEHLRAALFQLRYWTAANGYATTLPVSKLLMSWCGGSALLMDLINTAFMMLYAAGDFEGQHPNITAEINALYPQG